MALGGQVGGGSRITTAAGSGTAPGGAVTLVWCGAIGIPVVSPMIGGYASGSQIRAMIMDNTGSLFGTSDFSAGVGSSFNSPVTFRWYAMTKASGSAPYRFHYATYASSGALTWTHTSESPTHANDATTGDSWWLGAGDDDTALVLAAAWCGTALSDAAIEAACLRSTQAVLDASPDACWHFPEDTATDSVVDLTGGGADETARTGTFAALSDPTNFDFTVGGGGTDATVTPGVIAAVAAFPSATKSTGSTVSPARIAAAASLPSAAVRTGSTVSPATVAAVAAVPDASVSAGGSASITPATITAVAAFPSATKSAGSTVSPSAIAARAALPTAHVSTGSQLVYARMGGQLVSTTLRGAVRFGGSSVVFG